VGRRSDVARRSGRRSELFQVEIVVVIVVENGIDEAGIVDLVCAVVVIVIIAVVVEVIRFVVEIVLLESIVIVVVVQVVVEVVVEVVQILKIGSVGRELAVTERAIAETGARLT